MRETFCSDLWCFGQSQERRMNQAFSRCIASLGLVFALTINLQAATPSFPVTKEGLDLFEQKIRPALVRHCYECHSGDAAKAKGKLLLDTRDALRKGGQSGPVIIPGNASDSSLMEAIRHEGIEMPPKP